MHYFFSRAFRLIFLLLTLFVSTQVVHAATNLSLATSALNLAKSKNAQLLVDIFGLSSTSQLGYLQAIDLIRQSSTTRAILVRNNLNKSIKGMDVNLTTGSFILLVSTPYVMLDGRLSWDVIKRSMSGSWLFQGVTDEILKESIGYSNNIYKSHAVTAYRRCISAGILPGNMVFSTLFLKAVDMGIDPQHLIGYANYSNRLVVVNLSQYLKLSTSSRQNYLTVVMAHEIAHLYNKMTNPTLAPLADEMRANQKGYLAANRFLGSSNRVTQDALKAYQLFSAINQKSAWVCQQFGLASTSFKYLYYRGITPAGVITLYNMQTNKSIQFYYDAVTKILAVWKGTVAKSISLTGTYIKTGSVAGAGLSRSSATNNSSAKSSKAQASTVVENLPNAEIEYEEKAIIPISGKRLGIQLPEHYQNQSR